MNMHSRVYAKIDLSAVRHNMEEIHRLIKPSAKVIAVIKADAYGHGAAETADALEDIDYLYGFAVATAQEAFALRRHGIKKPILLLGCIFPEDYEMAVEWDIRPTVFTLDTAKALSKAAIKAGKKIAIHIKIDTGMSRIGMQVNEESVRTIVQIAALPHIIVEGIFTHFACADEADKTMTQNQLALFLQMIRLTEHAGIKIPYKHCSNSAGIIDLPHANMDFVRAGIILYGLRPSDEVHKERIGLKPALELKSRIAYIKDLEAGRSVSYGAVYTAKEPRRVATIPAGYGDGYPRSLSNKGWVLVRGKKAPILGRICMDQFMVDVTDIAGVQTGDPVTLAGTDGALCITLEELGALSGRFPYEFACGLSRRIPRVFYQDGILVSERAES